MRAIILFTDVEDSTGLAAALGPERYAETMLAHVAMARAAVAEAGGAARRFTGSGLLALWPNLNSVL